LAQKLTQSKGQAMIDDVNSTNDDGAASRTRASNSAKKNMDTAPWRRPRGRGKLKILPEMPMDILFEVSYTPLARDGVHNLNSCQIFSYLTPLDILHLSRTTKALRDILMSRSAITIWKSAFTFEPELPVPPDMSEPEWANLIFSPHCHASAQDWGQFSAKLTFQHGHSIASLQGNIL
jgi:hypothetical protein